MSKQQSTQINPSTTDVDIRELSRKVRELYSDYEWRQMFDKAQQREPFPESGEGRLAKTLRRLEDKDSYESIRGNVIEHISIMEGLVEGIMAAKENEQSITERTARGLLWEFERFAAAVHDLLECLDDREDF